MTTQNTAERVQWMLNQKVVGFFDAPVQLKSGRMSHWYINWRSVAEDVFLLDQITDEVLAFVREQGISPACFYGVAEGASKLALLCQYKWARSADEYGPGSHKLCMGRGAPKAHGAAKDRFFLGVPEGPTLILEDVTTTGGSLLKTVEQLRELNIPILGALSLTDRLEPRDDGRFLREVLAEMNIPFYSLCDARDLLPAAIRHYQPSESIQQLLHAERNSLQAYNPFSNEESP